MGLIFSGGKTAHSRTLTTATTSDYRERWLSPSLRPTAVTRPPGRAPPSAPLRPRPRLPARDQSAIGAQAGSRPCPLPGAESRQPALRMTPRLRSLSPLPPLALASGRSPVSQPLSASLCKLEKSAAGRDLWEIPRILPHCLLFPTAYPY